METSSWCTSAGKGAVAEGYCCIAIGDYTQAKGEFKVVVSNKITFPSNFTKNNAMYNIRDLEHKKTSYALVSGTTSHPEFLGKAEAAIDFLIKATKEQFGL
jgi:hypothetical protein